ncbi:hypothetical protein I4641_06260 [Waterburya agarophytonicola K14]|uniref:Uncharacterized protein n=1 Tax=Waterburya agarophytonicola KI4 TaxID=2874699 RepID=A0A964BNN2_9CYAN|nr:hypothetical protein [Waterburya agarophytonicola]MCC0176580.1 hypothetical protein [Waterburya agarophytonicola KI4]
MKKILCLSTVTLTILCQGTAISRASEVGMPDNDFTQLVCGYLHQMDDKSEALDKIKVMTELKINNRQLAKLEEIATSEQATRDFCSDSRPRL